MRRQDFAPPSPPAIDRPADRWICGHAAEGTPCPHGPAANGQCSAWGACQPRGGPGAWKCSRPTCLGGKCAPGPAEDGACGLTPTPCQPRPSWRWRRRRWGIGGAIATVGILILMLGGPWSSRLVRPGPLSRSHAQILGTRLASDRCASCHPAASASWIDWFRSARQGHEGVTQSQRCIDCHHAAIPREQAMLAHNLTEAQWQQVDRRRSVITTSWRDRLPRPEFATDQVPCAACHREHHGPQADLSATTNAQCQTCHQNRFAGFADGHPDWEAWPRPAAAQIAFDHRIHFEKHFTDSQTSEAARFRQDCRSCHPPTARGEPMRTVAYAAGCATCHQATLEVEAHEGVTLLAVPSLPDPSQAGLASWPAAASGFYDGRLGPLLRLLLRADRDVAEALDQLPPDGDFAKLEPDDPDQRRAAAHVAAAVASLFDAIAKRGRPAVVDRLVQQGAPPEAARRIGLQLSPQLVLDAQQRWFAAGRSPAGDPQPPAPRFESDPAAGASDSDDVLRDAADASLPGDPLSDDLLSGDLLSGDALSGDALDEEPRGDDLLGGEALGGEARGGDDPLAAGTSFGESSEARRGTALSPAEQRRRFDAEATMPAGGWYLDETRLAIRYLGSAHADPVLQSLIEIGTSLPGSAPERHGLLSLRATQPCLQCHTVGEPGRQFTWTTPAAAGLADSFTRFSHRPHLSIASLADCQHCHQLDGRRRDDHSLEVGGPEAAVQRAVAGRASTAASSDFLPLGRTTCVACHRPGGASDDCTQCHRYHIDPPQRRAPPIDMRGAATGGR